MKRLFVLPFILFFFGAVSTAAEVLPSGSSPYRLQISLSEARAALNEILDDARLRLSARDTIEPDVIAHAMRLSRAYREGHAPVYLSIVDGPFLGMLLMSGALKDAYSSQYKAKFEENYRTQVADISLETLFDDFMDLIIRDQVPEVAKKAAKEIDARLARKVLAGKASGCRLDLQLSSNPPTIFRKIYIRLATDLRLPFPSDCYIRQTVFNAAKGTLAAARSTPEVKKALDQVFREEFPLRFRAAFMDSIAQEKADLPKIISSKLSGSVDPFWGSTPLVEFEDNGSHVLSLKEFAAGLRADMALAEQLISSSDPEQRGMAAALFYASANRILLVQGGDEADWNGRSFLISPQDAYFSLDHKAKNSGPRPGRESEAPIFASHLFGGWGAEQSKTFAVYSEWNFETYDPEKKLRIFPSTFVFGPHGVPEPVNEAEPTESLGDLGDLAGALSVFLRATRPDGAFAPFFAQATNLSDLVDPTKPALFPKDGRLLAMGLVGAIFRNLINLHAQMVEPGTPGAGLGVLFRDRVSLDPAARPAGSDAVSVVDVAHALLAVNDLKISLNGDAAVPESLQARLPQLDSALQAGAWALSGANQGADGGFNEFLGQPLASGRKLHTQVVALRALARAYASVSRYPAMRLGIKLGWGFLDHLWGHRTLPVGLEGAQSDPLPPSALWELLTLWDETQGAVRDDLSAEIDWKSWETRFSFVRARAIQQLQTDVGPAFADGSSLGEASAD